MPFALLDDKFHSNPKILEVEDDGAGLYARALSYCADQLTDGFIPNSWARQSPAERLTKLVTHGLWIKVKKGERVSITRTRARRGRLRELAVTMPSDGYYIPDYLQENPSRNEVEEKRRKQSEGGALGASQRWTHQAADDSTHDRTHSSTHDISHDMTHGSTYAEAMHQPMTTSHAPRPSTQKISKGSTRSKTTRARDTPSGLPFEKDLLVTRLLSWIGGDADEGTPTVIRRLALGLSEGQLAKVLESARAASPRDRAAYVVAALTSEAALLPDHQTST